MERSENQWNEYLVNTEYPQELIDKIDRFNTLGNVDEITMLHRKIAPYRQLETSNLITHNCQKQIIKEPIKKFPGYHKYPPFAFRFQCLTTGRISKFIKVEDWSKYGITPQDGKTGGLYPDKMQIKNKLIPVYKSFDKLFDKALNKYREEKNLLLSEIEEIRKQYNWFDRYNEYLSSKCWSEKREKVLEMDEYRCLSTGSTKNIHVHHIHYNNVGCENISDIITVCKDIHKELHSYKGEDFSKRRMIEYECISKRCEINNLDEFDMWQECWNHDDRWFLYFAQSKMPKGN